MSCAELYIPESDSPRNIAIVGGGIASALLAHQLFRLNSELSITIYCHDCDIAVGASGNDQGAIYPHLQGSRSVLASVSAESFLYATRYYTELHQLLGGKFNYEKCGVLQQAHTPQLKERLQRVSEIWPEITTLIDSAQSSKLAGLELPYPSLWFENGGWLSPKQFSRELITYLAEQHSLTVKTSCLISEIRKSDVLWQLKSTEGSSFHHDAVALCAGYRTVDFQQASFLPLEPIRGQVSQMNPNTEFSALKTVLCHKGYATPSNGQVQSFGATFQKGSVDTHVDAGDNETNIAQIQKVYSKQDWSMQLSAKSIASAKAGIRGNSADHCPMVGALFSPKWIAQNVDKNTGNFAPQNATSSELSGLYVMTGLGARGITTGPLMAKHLSAIMLEKRFVLNEELTIGVSPSRFLVRQLKRTKGQHPNFVNEMGS